MGKNELRRDAISGNWTIIVKQNRNLDSILPKAKNQVNVQTSTSCAFCDGHEHETSPEIFAIRRDGTRANEPGWDVRVISEKFPVLQIHGDLNNRGVGIYDVMDGIGAHELVIETPQHRQRLADSSVEHVEKVFSAYRERYLDLKHDARFRYVLMHKTQGEGEGAISQHSYSHMIATPITPLLVKEELANSMAHYQYKERCLFCDVIWQEQESDQRVVFENSHFIAISPFASSAPFQLMVLPKRHETFFEWNNELNSLAHVIFRILNKLRNVLGELSYIMVIHSGPNIVAGKQRGYWKTLEKDYHWHIEINPMLTGFSSFEIGSGFHVNPVPPEIATEMLKSA